MFRCYLRNGQPTDRIDFTTGAFTTPVAQSIAEVAVALGCPISEVTSVDSTLAPAPIVIIPPTVVVAIKPPPSALHSALAAIAADPAISAATKTAITAALT